jgi:cell fate regulator YaaT (PSP1 superfamily)
MGCSGCSSGRGCSTAAPGLPGGCRNNGSCGTGGCNKLGVFDWLAGMELPHGQKQFDIVEVRFKNSRKEFFRNTDGIELNVGDVIAVESSPGHDMGVVSPTGELVKMQMKKKGIAFDSQEISDIQKWQEAQNLEFETMHKARKIAVGLGLQMKLSDVEFQGDKTKATFYYTADDRVDFRELIKLLASEFKVRIEMRQIGARQEASRLGGIGSCGRELCCSTWLTDFRTVNTSAARYQQLALNPLKLAGQCGKLKCCLNYELDSYLDAIKDIPMNDVKLETERGRAFHQKTDIFKRIMWYSYTDAPETFIPLTIEKVKEIMEMNTQGKKPADLQVHQIMQHQKEILPDYENVVGQDSISRFDNRKRNNKNRKPNQQGGQGGGNQNQKRRRPQGGNNNPNKKKGDAK